MWANAKSSRSFVRPAIFDLHLEWTVGVGGGGGEKRRVIFTPLPPPLSSPLLPPWYKFIPLPSLPLPLKLKIAAIIFNMNLLSTRSPKLRFLCRLKQQKIHICVLKSFPPNSVASIQLFKLNFLLARLSLPWKHWPNARQALLNLASSREALSNARGRSPRAVLKTSGTVFPNTDRPRLVNKILFFSRVIKARSFINWTILEQVNGS